MAFQPPNTGQERQNRKILEQLEEQKKRLRIMSATAPGTPPVSGPSPAVASSPAVTAQPMVLPETQPMNPAQRTALQHANANSFGYFFTQDSSFGNLILPVLPRFENVRT